MSATRILSPEEFARVRAQARKAIKARPALRVAKARITVNRPPVALGLTSLYVPKDVAENARHSFKSVPGRIMALDLSMAKTGMAWGKPGHRPEATLCQMGMRRGEGTEQEGLYVMAKNVAWNTASKQCAVAIFSEFYSAKNMLSFRANVALRGAVMAELTRYGIKAVSVPEITARKAAGVDIRKRQAHEPEKGWMKERAYARLNALGLGYLQEDEGDAALLLLGSWLPLGLPAPESTPATLETP